MVIKTIIRLQIGAQSAVMGPPLGPTLGQFGVSAIDFIKKFNELSSNYLKGIIVSTTVYVYANRTYDIKIVGPTVSFLFKKIYNCGQLNSSLKLFNNYNLLINNYIICELYSLINKVYSRYTGSNNIINVKSLKGQARSLNILYYFN